MAAKPNLIIQAGGNRTHNLRVMSHVLQSGSRSCVSGDEVLARDTSTRGSNPPTAVRLPDAMEEPMYSEPSVAVFETPNEVVAEMSSLIVRVGFRQWAHARPSRGDAVRSRSLDRSRFATLGSS